MTTVSPTTPSHLLFLCLLPKGICAEVRCPQHFKGKSECWTYVVMFICSECLYYTELKVDVYFFLITNLIFSLHRNKIYFCLRQNKIPSFSPLLPSRQKAPDKNNKDTESAQYSDSGTAVWHFLLKISGCFVRFECLNSVLIKKKHLSSIWYLVDISQIRPSIGYLLSLLEVFCNKFSRSQVYLVLNWNKIDFINIYEIRNYKTTVLNSLSSTT